MLCLQAGVVVLWLFLGFFGYRRVKRQTVLSGPLDNCIMLKNPSPPKVSLVTG